MIPSHASLPLAEIERAARCPACGGSSPKCGERFNIGDRLEVFVCVNASERDPIMWLRPKP